jgi:pyruvate-formate lyase-activating enzyme
MSFSRPIHKLLATSPPGAYNRRAPMRLPVIENTTRSHPHLESGPQSIHAVRVLRISVTDRCNFRCVYCMPEEGVKWLPKDGLLSFEEICDIVRAGIEIHGIRRFKLTGGEPTVRHGIVDLIRMIRRIPGVEDLSLTTNGMLLEDLAQPMRESGLDRVTISVDSLRPDRFRKITRTGELATVLRGLDRCEEVGFPSLKINCVTMRGTNDDELAEFARLSVDRRLTVRFIEYMPLGDAAIMHAGNLRVDESEIGPAGGCGAQDRGADAFISETEVRQAIETELGPLVPVDRPVGASASSAPCPPRSVPPAIAFASPPTASSGPASSKAAKSASAT